MLSFNRDKSYPTLFKRGVGGEVRVWRMERGEAADTDDLGTFAHRSVSGVLDGAETASGWSVAEPKNVGRSNATDSLAQAEAEIAAEYQKKLDRGYFKDRHFIDQVPFTKPMLAAAWEKRKDKIDISAGVYCQPKLDGIRCIARADGLWTRTGKPITALPHIEEALAPMFAEHPDLGVGSEMELDGELYNHDLRDDFNSITSIVRKAKPTEADLEKAREAIQFHVYDAVFPGVTFGRRFDLAVGWIGQLNHPALRIVPTHHVRDEAELDRLYGEWLEEGYEGQMIRLDASYENKRSNTLMKRKDFLSEEFEVVTVEEGNGNWRGCVKRFVVRLPDGRECGAGVRGTQSALRDLLTSGETPDWATVRFFTPTPDGMPRFPVVTDWGFGQRED